MKAWTETTPRLEIYRAESGWIIRRGTTGPHQAPADVAGIADDEGLLEWFAEQLELPTPDLQTRPPNPGSEAKPAEVAVAPPPVASPITPPAIDAAVHDALQPFVDLLIHRRRDDDDYCVDLYMVPDPADAYRPYRLVNLGHARALVRAAGLWTSAMDAVVDGALVADAATTREASSSPEAPSATPEAVAAPPPPAPSREDEDIPF